MGAKKAREVGPKIKEPHKKTAKVAPGPAKFPQAEIKIKPKKNEADYIMQNPIASWKVPAGKQPKDIFNSRDPKV